MSTPERARKRQMMEGAVLVMLALFTVCQALYFNLQDFRQRSCFGANFAELSVALEVRSELNERDSQNVAHVIEGLADAVRRSNADVDDLNPALQTFLRERGKIEAVRTATPLPPYPVGECRQ